MSVPGVSDGRGNIVSAPVAGSSSSKTSVPPVKATSKRSKDRSDSAPQSLSMRNLTVLIVDDNSVIRHTFRAIVNTSLAPRKLETVESGQIAIDLCKSTKYDVIFMDLNMPTDASSLDEEGHPVNTTAAGIWAARVIHKMHPESIILAHTSEKEEDVKDDCFKAGMSGFLPKTTTVPKIRSTVEELLAVRDIEALKI
ncbi:MAG: Protein-glutamate methylesterase/protein-glutamine glutaminase [Chlamydiia bacterium]|nr:Protein-glutamate methylesterase/protein-glutamine glutaminase [Chlamydiia bacterium]